MSRRLYLDIHIIQTAPPSNLNRDDAGSPKDAQYGGVRRARVSSQSWKRAARRALIEDLPPEQRSLRTERLEEAITERLREGAAGDADRIELAPWIARGAVATLIDKWKSNKRHHTSYTMFLQRSAIDQVATALEADWNRLQGITKGKLKEAEGKIRQADEEIKKAEDQAKKKGKATKKKFGDTDREKIRMDVVTEPLKGLLKPADLWGFLESKPYPPEIALFGRMVADRTEFNVDAAVQVAHALSTHNTHVEFDYFTTVEEYQSGGERGNEANGDSSSGGPAAMLGTVEFNAATYYRFATVAVHRLFDNLSGADSVIDDTARVVRDFLRAFTMSMPTGHQNSFGHTTKPHLLVVAARSDGPVNLVTAFEEPIVSREGRAGTSMVALAHEAAAVAVDWGCCPDAQFATYMTSSDKVRGELVDVFGESLPFGELLRTVEDFTATRLREAS